MCGIAGLVVPPASSIPLDEYANRMADSLLHRGPDSQGIWSDPAKGLLFVHRRLAIQDLTEQGSQPMRSTSGRFCIVFNGEIYNFRNLSEELKSLGHVFSGHSDTEVLLSAIEEWGLDAAVRRCTGMFALALWDAKDRTISLCRDRLGEKPLYYGWVNNTFCFASELKAIESVIPRSKLEISTQGLLKYLQYGYITAPESIYRGIYKLVPGTILRCPLERVLRPGEFSPCADRRGLSPKTFWSLLNSANRGLNDPLSDETEAVDALDGLLHKTIRNQMIADVGVGVFLSGGIDSSTVAAIAQSESASRIRTFSIGFSEKDFDESMYAAKVAEHLGTDHTSIEVSPEDTLRVVPDIPRLFDEPFADSSQIPTYIVSGLARKEVTVCLSGDGGDELFAGYNRYLSTDRIWQKIGKIPWPLRNASGKLLSVPSPRFWDSMYERLLAGRSGPMGAQKLVGLKLQKLAGLMQKKDLMTGYDYLLSYWNDPRSVTTISEPGGPSCGDPVYPRTDSFLDKAMFLDQAGYLQGDNLAKVDRASMAVSLETRLPLLSHEVVDLSWRIPVSMKVRGKVSKWILRQVLYRYVPQELIDRPKMGFSVPVAHWLRKELREWASDLIGEMHVDDFGYLDPKPVLSAWHEHQAGKYDHSQRLWTVLMLISWLRERR